MVLTVRPKHALTRSGRIGALAALLLLGALAAVLLYDVATLASRWAFPRPIAAAGFAEVAGAQGRSRTLNALVAIAARELADGPVESLLVPEDRKDIVAVEPDSFADIEQQTIDPRLIAPFVGGNVSVSAYEPRVAASTIAAWENQGTILEFPRGVFAVKADTNSTRYMLYANETGTALYVVPEDLAPADADSKAGTE